MRAVFMGTPPFAVPSLRALASAHEVAVVYTRPDRPAGRGREPRPSAVKVAAEELGLTVEQPPSWKDAAAVERLRSLAPDVVCVVAYGAILPKTVLDIPRLGCINVHASLLPRYRGAAPIERAVLAGEPEAGVSVMRMDEGLDTGAVAVVRRVPAAGRSAAELREVLAELGAEALLCAIDDLGAGRVQWQAQDEELATYADKITSEDVALSPGLTAPLLARRVLASGESAVSRAVVAGRLATIEEVEACEDSPGPGRVAADGAGLVLGTIDGGLLVRRLTPAGKRSMSGVDFARGARITSDSTWDAPE
jgi:methionyl-tRNA formyltransferase